VQISDEEFDRHQEAILNGEPLPETKKIADIPDRAKQWFKENAERINGWKSTPYFLKLNPEYVGKLLK
jgi:ABC-type proline/glycine betaine transport system substrate-binding protein